MGLRYYKRFGSTKGLGFTISNLGISSSYRTRYGTLGASGFSLKTGIPGLTFRQGFRRKNKGMEALIVLAVVCVSFMLYYALVAAYNLARFLIWGVRETVKFLVRNYRMWKEKSTNKQPL
ncbi:hypothetical protein [Flavobacterium sp.]|uniref:hypothetical protein n=1 Tax=Flavobacterium sp. TaxID=239 RepID=UPI001210C5E1|nr:hypothetical protein [Flavobacterium sp.]RZJ69812.1 MAG: hypothetical protein EOO49_16275 [Flavobacterium sp.]